MSTLLTTEKRTRSGRPKRTPSNTVANRAKLMTHAADVIATPLRPPAHVALRPQDEPFWDDIIRARAREEWGKIELTWAVQLARVMADIEARQRDVDSQPSVVETGKGTPIANPIANTLNTLVARQFTLARALKIVGGVVGDTIMQLPQRKAEREAENTLKRIQANYDSDGEESLLML